MSFSRIIAINLFLLLLASVFVSLNKIGIAFWTILVVLYFILSKQDKKLISIYSLTIIFALAILARFIIYSLQIPFEQQFLLGCILWGSAAALAIALLSRSSPFHDNDSN